MDAFVRGSEASGWELTQKQPWTVGNPRLSLTLAVSCPHSSEPPEHLERLDTHLAGLYQSECCWLSWVVRVRDEGWCPELIQKPGGCVSDQISIVTPLNTQRLMRTLCFTLSLF